MTKKYNRTKQFNVPESKVIEFRDIVTDIGVNEIMAHQSTNAKEQEFYLTRSHDLIHDAIDFIRRF